MSEIILNIGRYGDIIGLLPYCYARKAAPVTLLVGADFKDVLDGVSYVKRLTWSRGCDTLPEAIAACKRQFPAFKVAQAWRNPDSRQMCESFAIESYRYLGAAAEYGTHPTVFDRRDPDREKALVEQHRDGRRLILCAGGGISSPFPHALVPSFEQMFPACQVLDMAAVRAEKVFDLLGLIDQADLLVSVDTVHLWLARASRCPVAAFINDGWRGSPIPPTTIAHMRYVTANVPLCAQECRALMEGPRRTIMVVDRHGDTERHRTARKTWYPDVLINRTDWGRDARDIGDKPLPYLRDLLQAGLRVADDGDIIVWTNGDVQTPKGSLEQIARHASLYGACSTRRAEGHIGRELFAFSASWLRDHLADLPDGILGRPWFDLAVAAWIRRTKGIRSTLANLHDDWFPSEILPCVVHPEHESGWLGTESGPAAKHNERIWLASV